MSVWLVSAMSLLWTTPLAAQTYETAVVEGASEVLDEIMAAPARRIPESLLADAQGIVIIPNLVKGGFVVGVRHGRGVVVVRDDKGAWGPPSFVLLTGGSVGWQIGLQAVDLILVFKTRNSVRRLMQGKFTVGVDAAAAAGPVGRQAAAATDLALKAEILSYSRSRGLFAGVSLDGSALRTDPNANAVYYATAGASAADLRSGQPIRMPPSAARLLEQLASYAAAPATAPGGAAQPFPAGDESRSAIDAQALQRQLADSSRQLYAFLDEPWKKYLALPAEIYTADRTSSVDALSGSLARYEHVRSGPSYQSLAQRPEFQATYGLLKAYVDLRRCRTASTLALPPPPR